MLILAGAGHSTQKLGRNRSEFGRFASISARIRRKRRPGFKVQPHHRVNSDRAEHANVDSADSSKQAIIADLVINNIQREIRILFLEGNVNWFRLNFFWRSISPTNTIHEFL